jgi:hypothetical protein
MILPRIKFWRWFICAVEVCQIVGWWCGCYGLYICCSVNFKWIISQVQCPCMWFTSIKCYLCNEYSAVCLFSLWCVFLHLVINYHVCFLLSCRNRCTRNHKSQRFVCNLFSFFVIWICSIDYWTCMYKKKETMYITEWL